MNKNFKYMLLFSAAVHVFFMSVIGLKNPAENLVRPPYTKVSFLGPLFKKTAFDLMLESSDRVILTEYQGRDYLSESGILRPLIEKQIPEKEKRVKEYFDFKHHDDMGRLLDEKTRPSFMLDAYKDDMEPFNVDGHREVVYKPQDIPGLASLYGDNTDIEVRAKVLVASGGEVKMAELLSATGYPDLDIAAMNYFKKWRFKPDETKSDPSWVEVKMVIKMQEHL